MEEIKKEAEVLNSIAGSETNETISSFRQILYGYSNFAVEQTSEDGSEEKRKQMKYNLYLLNSIIDVLEKSR